MAAIGSDANAEFEIVRLQAAAIDTWYSDTVPRWCRLLTVRNEHPTADLLVADPRTAAGAHALGSDHYLTVPAGQAVTFALDPGRGQGVRTLVYGRTAGAGSRDIAVMMGG